MRLAEKKKKRLDSYMPCGAMALTLKYLWRPADSVCVYYIGAPPATTLIIIIIEYSTVRFAMVGIFLVYSQGTLEACYYHVSLWHEDKRDWKCNRNQISRYSTAHQPVEINGVTMAADFLRVNIRKKKLYWRSDNVAALEPLPHFNKNGCLHQTRAHNEILKVA